MDMLSQPASLEYFEADLGIPWFAVPLLFVIIVGLTVALLPGAAARSGRTA